MGTELGWLQILQTAGAGGAAIAVIVAVIIFIRYLAKRDKDHAKQVADMQKWFTGFFEQTRNAQDAVANRFAQTIENINDRNIETQNDFIAVNREQTRAISEVKESISGMTRLMQDTLRAATEAHRQGSEVYQLAMQMLGDQARSYRRDKPTAEPKEIDKE